MQPFEMISAWRKTLGMIRDMNEPHTDASGKFIDEEPECHCERCLAVRALKLEREMIMSSIFPGGTPPRENPHRH